MSKTSLVPIETLARKLRKRFRNAAIALDRPKRRSGVWYLDVTRDGYSVVIQWREGAGFGVSASSAHAYGEGADEFFQEEEAAYGRAISLLLSRTFTSPPEPVRLKELRNECGMSQAELAAILNKQQGEISKIERRQDVRVSTLRDYIESMGGTLQISARMADGSLRSLVIEDREVSAARE
jgi:DNA-binding XRE family transcriptional regulator